MRELGGIVYLGLIAECWDRYRRLFSISRPEMF